MNETDIEAAERHYRAEERVYEALAPGTSKKDRVDSLHRWNDAAREYFTLCIKAFVQERPKTSYSRNAAWAGDWLKIVADHFSALKREVDTRKLPLDFERLKPNFMKFVELQRMVAEREPAAARELRNRFIQIGLEASGFDGQSAVESMNVSQERKKFFVVGCVVIAIAIAFAGWAFADGDPGQRDKILAWALSLAAGFIAGAFAGSIALRSRGLVPSAAVAATGGFAVWLITFLLLSRPVSTPLKPIEAIPKPTAGSSPVTTSKPLVGPCTYRYLRDSQMRRSAEDSTTLQFRVSAQASGNFSFQFVASAGCPSIPAPSPTYGNQYLVNGSNAKSLATAEADKLLINCCSPEGPPMVLSDGEKIYKFNVAFRENKSAQIRSVTLQFPGRSGELLELVQEAVR